MNDTESSNQENTYELSKIVLATGVVEGGCEQVILDVLPPVLENDQVKHWSFERASDARWPIVQVLLDLDPQAVDDVIEQCEELLDSKMADDPRLALTPLIEISGVDAPDDSELPYGVRHERINMPDVFSDMEKWWGIEMALGRLARKLLALIREIELDRKSLAPPLLYLLLSRTTDKAQVAAAAHQVSEQLLQDNENSEELVRQFRINVHSLSQRGIKFLDPHLETLRNDEEIGSALGRLCELISQISESSQQRRDAFAWQRFSNKLGFNALEAAYIACMVSQAAREEVNRD